jgi:AmmeMemoRadiSam system protein B/AmmeMemoRadiSam system protein A
MGHVRGMAAICVVLAALSPLAYAALAGDPEVAQGGKEDMGASQSVRPPAVAGAFYPGTPDELRKDVTDMLAAVKPAHINGRVVALISPHAGYIYSGEVAAHGYRLIEGKRYDAVIVIAPSHHVAFSGCSIYDGTAYQTPLGLAEINTDLARRLLDDYDFIISYPQAHLREHALEVQLPFLQIAVPDLRIVPIIMGDQSLAACRRLADAIAESTKGLNVLIVASSDLSHFHTYDSAVELDNIVVERVRDFDPEGLAHDLASGKCEACGGGPIITAMLAAKLLGADSTEILQYANSGDTSGDKSRVVGYLSAAIYDKEDVGVNLGLGHDEKVELLKIARKSVEAAVRGEAPPEFSPASPLLKEKRGAFVTLTEGGRLRGCIGQIRGIEPLYLSVSHMARSAALEDPRFDPVKPPEVDRLEIEISVLTPFERMSDPSEIMVGTHGLYIEKGYNHGLLLPQVATDYGWDRYQFLDQTCNKAGLPAGAWKEGADIYLFSAQIFNEQEVFGTGG